MEMSVSCIIQTNFAVRLWRTLDKISLKTLFYSSVDWMFGRVYKNIKRKGRSTKHQNNISKYPQAIPMSGNDCFQDWYVLAHNYCHGRAYFRLWSKPILHWHFSSNTAGLIFCRTQHAERHCTVCLRLAFVCLRTALYCIWPCPTNKG